MQQKVDSKPWGLYTVSLLLEGMQLIFYPCGYNGATDGFCSPLSQRFSHDGFGLEAGRARHIDPA